MASRIPPGLHIPPTPRTAWSLAGAEAADFHDQLQGWRLGAALIARRRTSARRLVRSRALVQSHETPAPRVILQVSGRFQGDYDGREAQGGPGVIRVVDLARPFDVVETEAETLELSLPHDRLDLSLDVHGLVFAGDHPMAHLLAGLLQGLVEAAPHLTPTEALAAGEAACALAVGLIGGRIDREAPYPAIGESRLFMAARRYIDAQLNSRDLNPAALGAHLGVSRRTLYRLFDGQHGVAGYIQQRRLERAFDAIAQTGGPWTSLADIAYAHGFQSEAHFSRAFRARFGLRPGEARSLRREDPRP